MSETVPYPTVVVCFLLGNQFCERFNYYGLRTILSIYISEELDFSEHDTVIIYHCFAMLVYAFPLVGAVIADSWWGKFKTIFYITMLYITGNAVLAISAIEPIGLPPREFALVALLLIAIGTGGIKACVAAFGGDQFVLPQQEKDRESYYHLFYISINVGSLMSMFLVPVFRKNVQCFNKPTCYPLAFGVPGMMMVVGFTLLIIGKPFYKIKAPEGNMLLKISKCISTAVNEKRKSDTKKDHWLDFAIEKHGQKMVKEIKIAMKVLYLYLPLLLFWALYEQIATAWTFQARRMNGEVGDQFIILPDQMQICNPIMVIVFIPIIDYVIYPYFGAIGMLTTPLQKIATGGVLTAVAYAMTAFLEVGLENTFPILPAAGNAQIRIFNILPCDIKVTSSNLNNGNEISIPKLDFYTQKFLPVKETASYSYSMSGDCSSASGEFKLYEEKAAAFFFNEKGKPSTYIEDYIDKLMSGNPNIRLMINLNGVVSKEITVTFITSSGYVYKEVQSSETALFEMNPGTYDVQFGDVYTIKQKFSLGGVYTFAAIATSNDKFDVKNLEVTQHNTIHILWMIPQYAVITMGECMLSITGIEFAYSQAPQSMKSVMQAGWLLTSAFGQLFVIIIESLLLFNKRSSMFFLYAAIMIVDMIIFTMMTLNYVYVDEAAE